MRIFVLLMVLAISNGALAGDQWFRCSTADRSAKIDGDMLDIVDGIGEIGSDSFTVDELRLVEEKKHVCTLKDSGEKFTYFYNKVSVVRVTYTLEEDQVKPSSEYMICEHGIGGYDPEEICE